MRLATFEFQNRIRIGVVKDETLLPLDGVASDMVALIEQGTRGLDQARQVLANPHEPILLSQVRLLAPIPRPRKNISPSAETMVSTRRNPRSRAAKRLLYQCSSAKHRRR